MDELYKKFRPKSYKYVEGQEAVIKMLETFGPDKVPHTLLLTGPSGCGKTTIGRIVASQVGCHPDEVREINCADSRGIDLARDLRTRSQKSPLRGKRIVWILDEVHAMTKDAQSLMLKLLEDTPKHVWFVLCTTEPQKLLPTIITRSTQIKLSPLSPSGIKSVISRVVRLSKISVGEDAIDAIVNEANGSARAALVLLNQIKDIKGEEQQREAVTKASFTAQAFDLAKKLMDPRAQWSDIGPLLKELKDEEPEGLRRMILGYANAILTGSSGLVPRAALVIDRMQGNFFDSGKAGLSLACYEIVVLSKK